MQQRVLVRARNLAAFRRALADWGTDGDPLSARRRAIIVPTRASAELLRQTIEGVAHDSRRGVICPELFTRDEWLLRLHQALPGELRWLSPVDRIVILEAAARRVVARRQLERPPFRLRPGLLSAMLDFYDELGRRQRTVRRFARAVFDELRVERGTDRGSESLIEQTAFLGFVFLAYARGVVASGSLDEHRLRSLLVEQQPRLPFDDLIVAVADHPADPRGLWPADFDLIGRLTHLSRVTVVMTDEAHDAGFRARVELELPGIEEQRARDIPSAPIIISTRPSEEPPVTVARDREEELRSVVRQMRAHAEARGGALDSGTAIVFHRPLPYLYLAQQVLSDGGVPYQAFDALPLAVEPYSALFDQVLAVVRTDGSRDAVLALLRSRLMRWDVAGHEVAPRDVAALEDLLADRRSTAAASSFPEEVDRFERTGGGRRIDVAGARRAAAAAREIAVELAATGGEVPASTEIRRLAAFLRQHERSGSESGRDGARARRARAAVLSILDAVASAFERHDDIALPISAVQSVLHHALESRTFSPGRQTGGVHLVDAASARFGEFTDVFLVGLVETDWAERPRRNVFYSATLLKALGWPQETDQVQAQQAAFRDVLTLARERTRLSAFQLEGDVAVGLSTMIEAVRGLPTVVEPAAPRRAVFADEVLTQRADPIGMDSAIAAWVALRRARPPLTTPSYGGFISARRPEVYRVSRVDRYVACPFKYYADHVLGLPEEREELAGLSPIERGTLMHEVFEKFYRTWDADPGGAITAANLPRAERLFASITDEALARLPDPDRVLERMRLLGSIVSPGVADRVFALEVASPAGVVGRLVESEIEGPFRFPVRAGLDFRTIEIRGKTDRIDLLDDDSLRVVDYKLGRMPDLETSLQIGVYAHCASQLLERKDGRAHPVSAASYLAFGDEQQFEGRLAGKGVDVQVAVAAKADAFAASVARIEAGEFPPRPRTFTECQWCGFASVCRKEYRVEEVPDDSTEPV